MVYAVIVQQSLPLRAIRPGDMIYRGTGNLSLKMSFKVTSRHLQYIRNGLAVAIPFSSEPSAIHAWEKGTKKKYTILINIPSDPKINIYFPHLVHTVKDF